MGVPAANVEVKSGPDAKHGMPIKGLPPGARHCKLPDPSYLVQCDYGAAELTVGQAAAPPSRVINSRRLI